MTIDALPRTQDFVNGQVSFWLRDAGVPPRRPGLPGPITVDVAIVGAGLTGLWSAYYLKKARPELAIAVLEKEFAGYGASGRNGGWLSGEPAGQFRRYAKAHGADSAVALQRSMFNAIDEILAVASAEGIDADIQKDGLLHVATNPAQLERLKHHVLELGEQGWGADDVFCLSPSELRNRVNVSGALGAFWTPHCARIHPAKFVFGLARAVERLGVTIYEGTAVDRIGPGVAVTNRGIVSARQVVRALEGYTDSLCGHRRMLLPMNSSMVITEPLPARVWDEIGWQGAELVGDMGHSFAYSHRTADGRIALGGRGVPYNFASGFDPDGRTAQKAIGQLTAKMRSLFPAVSASSIQHSWSGVLGVPRDWCASVQYDPATGMGSAGGYVGQLPLGAVMGHDHTAVGDTFEPVENDDVAAFSAEFEQCIGSIEVSRVAAGHANSLMFEVFCENGAATFDQRRPAEIGLFLSEGASAQNGYRQVILGPEHPYIAGGLPMDAPSVGFGQNEAFAYQARAFLEEVAGLPEAESLPRCATFDEGVRNMEVLAAVVESAQNTGKKVSL